jgi:hypothetical protein
VGSLLSFQYQPERAGYGLIPLVLKTVKRDRTVEPGALLIAPRGRVGVDLASALRFAAEAVAVASPRAGTVRLGPAAERPRDMLKGESAMQGGTSPQSGLGDTGTPRER